MKRIFICGCLALAYSNSQATVINTTDASAIAEFQKGLKVVDFESVPTRTPQTITTYTQGDPVDPGSFVFDQIPGVQFSVGGAVGTNEPALFKLSGAIAGDAHSGHTVLGPVDFDFTTKFGPNGLIEIFFPVKVSKVGFWLNPSLGDAHIIAANTNFAFSHETETNLEQGDVNAGRFVGIERSSADIGGFKIEGLGSKAFTIDDFSFGAAAVPEPSTWGLVLFGLVATLFGRRWSSRKLY
jgi:hypothetical protein